MIGLIIVDLQNDFVDGALPVPDGRYVCQDVNTYMRRHERYKVASKDRHIDVPDHFAEFGAHCEKGSRGEQFFHLFNSNYVDEIVAKGAYDAAPSAFDGFDRTGRSLNTVLKDAGIKEIEVCGLAADVCVKATCLDGIHLGYHTTLLSGLTRAIGGDMAMRETINEIRGEGGYVR